MKSYLISPASLPLIGDNQLKISVSCLPSLSDLQRLLEKDYFRFGLFRGDEAAGGFFFRLLFWYLAEYFFYSEQFRLYLILAIIANESANENRFSFVKSDAISSAIRYL
jgi:hypothetical protein